jgi:hypothetical protein
MISLSSAFPLFLSRLFYAYFSVKDRSRPGHKCSGPHVGMGERSCDVLIKCLQQTHHQSTACHIWNRIFHNIQTPISTSLHIIYQIIYSFIRHVCVLLPLGLIISFTLTSCNLLLAIFIWVLSFPLLCNSFSLLVLKAISYSAIYIAVASIIHVRTHI